MTERLTGAHMSLSRFSQRVKRLSWPFVLSGLLALILAILLLALILLGDSTVRLVAAVGLFGLLVGAQLVILFVRPADRSPLGQARQSFSAGQFEMAARQIETLLDQTRGKPDPRALILLGNSYRQLGRLADSQAQLERALQVAPRQSAALYGMGRTTLAQGNFIGAIDWFDQALAAGAPPVIGCEIGLASFLAGDRAEALPTLQKMTRRLQIEPYRAWLVNGLLLLSVKEQSPTVALLRANIKQNADGQAYWQADAERHHATRYGERLAALLRDIDARLVIPETAHD